MCGGAAGRHIFEDKRYVEEYRTADLEGELGLDRDALIRMALLLGRCVHVCVNGCACMPVSLAWSR